MGGYGSGQYQSFASRDTVEDLKYISVFFLNQHRMLTGSYRSGVLTWQSKSRIQFVRRGNTLTLYYTFTTGPRSGQAMEYDVQLMETSPHFGGKRYWFSCPECNRRCGLLHLANDSSKFLCRICANLAYQSTREPRLERVLASLVRIESREAARAVKHGLRTGL